MFWKLYFLWLITGLPTLITEGSLPCVPRDVGNGGSVCVCNATYCDTISRVKTIPKGTFVMFLSSKDGLRLNKTTNQFQKSVPFFFDTGFSWWSSQTSLKFSVNPTKKMNTIMGFGGAFTDSTGINIMSLSKAAQENLLRSYFSVEGIEYNLCRVPIGGTDFSTRPYSYDDGKPDPELKNFALAKEDIKYKIPLIKRAQGMSEREIKFISACWSPPPWMKSNNDYKGFGYLKEEYFDVYVDYMMRFLDEYGKNGIKMWALSTGNEPNNGLIPVMYFNSLGWTPLSLANWTVQSFGPRIRNSKHKDLVLLTYDDQRLFLPWWIDLMMKADRDVLKYVDGFAVHWYWDFLVGVGVINSLHEKYPDKMILYTEACLGDKPWEKKVDFGSWERGELYLANIIQNLNADVISWLDWNMALDLSGGPTWARNFVDSPILVDARADEFYKQPMFYALVHVAKFIERGAERVAIDPNSSDKGVHSLGVKNPDGRIVLVFLNLNDKLMGLNVNIPGKGWIRTDLPPRSFATILC